MTIFFRLAILAATLSLAGCSLTPSTSFQTRDRQYLNARSIQPIRVPPGISTSAFHNDYPVTNRYYPEQAKEVSLVPPGLNS